MKISLLAAVKACPSIDSLCVAVLIASQDARIYIWHKENGTLIETLEGHAGGCVNAVAWNSSNPGMFASAGDDRMIRM